MFSVHFKSYFDVTKWLYLSVWVVYLFFSLINAFPLNAIILFIQTNSRTRNAQEHKSGIYHMNHSQQNIASHIKSYRDGGIASSHVILPHSFSVTPH